MNCNEFGKIINEYLDSALSDEEKSAAEEHIKYCEKCQGKVKVYEKLSESIKMLDDEKIPDDFKVEFPKKKNVLYVYFRKYEKVAASLVAALALVIFANGIEFDKYKAPESEIPPAQKSVIMPLEKEESIKADEAEEKAEEKANDAPVKADTKIKAMPKATKKPLPQKTEKLLIG